MGQEKDIAKLSPSPSPSLRLRWLYFQLSLPPTQPPTHPDKFRFGIGQHNSQKQSCLSIWVGPINAFGSILSPIIADLDQHQASLQLGWAWPSLAPTCFPTLGGCLRIVGKLQHFCQAKSKPQPKPSWWAELVLIPIPQTAGRPTGIVLLSHITA